MIIRIHQPLWGGFPMHWVHGYPIANYKLTDDRALADDYLEGDAKAIEADLRKTFPNAIVHIR